MLQQMIERVQRSRYTDEIMVVTTDREEDEEIIKLCRKRKVRVGTGSQNDVLDRFYQNAKPMKPEYVIRLTADCPCIDAGLIDQAILQMNNDTDYFGMLSGSFADGLDIEIMKFTALEKAWNEAVHSYEREHVTQYIIRHPELFQQQDFVSPIGYFGDHRWTVDEEEDFALVTSIFEHFLTELNQPLFGYQDILAYLKETPDLMKINKIYRRNEGLEKSIRKDVVMGGSLHENSEDRKGSEPLS